MKLQLLGYFDKNFGDDVMQLITVNAFPEHEFYVYGEQREFCLHLRGCPNVHIVETPPETDAFVNVIGTGFKYDSKKTLALKALTFFREKSFGNKKSAVIDCSMDPPKNALQKFFIKRELNKYALLSCRDALSEQWIKTLAPKKHTVRHVDIVFAADRQLLYPIAAPDRAVLAHPHNGHSGKNGRQTFDSDFGEHAEHQPLGAQVKICVR